MNKILISGVAVGLFLSLTWLYGNARYAAGVSDCKLKNAQSLTQAVNKTRAKYETNGVKVDKMESNDVNNALLKLGIMRSGD